MLPAAGLRHPLAPASYCGLERGGLPGLPEDPQNQVPEPPLSVQQLGGLG